MVMGKFCIGLLGSRENLIGTDRERLLGREGGTRVGDFYGVREIQQLERASSARQLFDKITQHQI